MEVQIEAQVTDVDRFEEIEDELAETFQVNISQEEPPGAFPGPETELIIEVLGPAADLGQILLVLRMFKSTIENFVLSAEVDQETTVEEFLEDNAGLDPDSFSLIEKTSQEGLMKHIYREDGEEIRHIIKSNEDGKIVHYEVNY